MPRLVNSEYSRDALRKGQTVEIPTTSAIEDEAVVYSKEDGDAGAVQASVIPIPLDQHRNSKPIVLTQREMQDIEQADVLPRSLQEGVRGLIVRLNKFIMEKAYKRTYNFVGTPGSVPFQDSGGKMIEAAAANRLLDIGLAPEDDGQRFGVIDPYAKEKASLLDQVAKADQAGTPMGPLRGMLGERYGINWLMDQTVLLHVAGTPGGTPLVNGAHAVDATSIGIKGLALGTGDYHEGDIVTFAGDPQTYVVTADATADGSGNLTLPISPGLKVALTGDEAVALKGTHRVNLIFHRDAIGFAQAPLADPGSENSTIAQLTDEMTGISLRLETKWQRKQRAWEYDLLYGSGPVRPEWIVRVAGQDI